MMLLYPGGQSGHTHLSILVWNISSFFVFDGQDKFDHDKGQKSAISGGRLHWRLSTGFFAFSPIFVCNFKTSPLKSGESSEKSSGDNRVKSCYVCGCHGFFGPEMVCQC